MFRTLVRRCVQTQCKRLSKLSDLSHVERRSLSAKASATGGNSKPETVEDMLKLWFKRFSDAQVYEPLESIANILASTLNSNKIATVYQERDRKLSTVEMKNIIEMCKKRLQRMPIQYVIGQWDFRELTLKLRPPVFIPRPETEILVELALNDIKSRDVTCILEPCCGSGAISLALLNLLPGLKAVACDKSSKACELTEENASDLKLSGRLEVQQCAIGDIELKNKFDLIISNPPYVLSKDMMDLQAEILLFEDLEALDGGLDGLDVVRDILGVATTYLNRSGKLFLEVDPSHPELIANLLTGSPSLGLKFERSHKDFNDVARFVEIIKT